MDPVKNHSRGYDDEWGNGIDQDDANRLATLVLALDTWQRSGGLAIPRRLNPHMVKRATDKVRLEIQHACNIPD